MSISAKTSYLPSVKVVVEELAGFRKNKVEWHKPTVVIFDPLVGFHWPLLKPCFGDLTSLLNILKFDAKSFSRSEIDKGSIGPNLSKGYIIGLHPVLIIAELILAPYTMDDCYSGIKMLTNLFSNCELDQAGLILISSFSKPKVKKALDEASLKLRVKKAFDWDVLKKEESQRRALYYLIFEAYAGNIPDQPNMNKS